ncbi:MAG TPA: hypothetical protein VIV11_02570 [Kofleriaceae bacterium]
MTRLRTIPISAALIAGCTSSGDDGAVIMSTTDWHANITGIGAFASIRGTSDVVVASDGGSFAVTTELTNAPAGGIHPWHVHAGACPGGAIVGATHYPELVVGSDGTAMADVTVAASLDNAAPYSINVHLSPDNLATLVACGDLVNLSGGGGGGGGGGGDEDDDRPDY